jgi:hypothetical protein
MYLEDIECSLIKGLNLGLEYENDNALYGNPNLHYIVLDLFVVRFIFSYVTK